MNITTGLSPKWNSFLSRSTTNITIETCVYVLIGLTSIVGNLLVIVSVYRNRSLRTSTNYLALSLAITDILYPLTILPLSVYWLIDVKTSHFTFSQEVCDFQAVWFLTLTNTSGYTIALMAYNRFVCVCKTDQYKHKFTKKKTIFMCISVWIVCFIVSMLLVKGSLYYSKFFPQSVMCLLSRKTKTTATKIFGNVLNAASVAVPYAIILYCYFKILKKIRHHKRNVQQARTNHGSLGAQEIKVTWTLFAVLLGYLVIWLTVLIVGITNSYNKGLPHHVTIILPISIACSSAINPMIYGAMNHSFRKEYLKIFRSIASSTSHLFSNSYQASSRVVSYFNRGQSSN